MDSVVIETHLHRRIETQPDGRIGGWIEIYDTFPYGEANVGVVLQRQERIRLGMACLGRDLREIFDLLDESLIGLRMGGGVEKIASSLSHAEDAINELKEIANGDR